MIAPRKAATWVTICVGCVAGFEGLRQAAYIDPVGIPTVCFGETRDVKLGDKYTAEQCREMLGARVQEFGAAVDKCVTVALAPARKAAYVSLAFNIGESAFCRSTVARRANAGDAAGSCDAILWFNKAGGVVWPGLDNRRRQEKQLCMEGIT